MADKVLFPSETDWKYARLIQRDGAYVVQSRYNETTTKYEQEVVIDIKTNPCPQLQAFNLYCETLCEAVGRKLRQRKDYAEWAEENRIKQEEDDGNLHNT